jgi:hypothetical protein
MTRKSMLQKIVKMLKSTNTVNLAIVMPKHDTKIEYEDWTTEVISLVRAFYVTTIYTTGLNDQSLYDKIMKDPKTI